MQENIVKKACKELGITQKELAERLGAAEQTVRNWASKDEVPLWAEKSCEYLLEINSLKSTLQDKDNTLKVLKSFKDLLNNI